MGIEYVDYDTIGHLLGGVLSCSLLTYSKIPVLANFGIANGIHYIIEKTEKSVAPNGRVLETIENHIGDILAFLLGWMIAYVLRIDRYITSGNALFLWIVLVGFIVKEVIREIYPYASIVKGAYTMDK
jgi:phosphotransferase system  glucose/maltose/N-acetylglucosamine-specific IIC component